MPALMSFGLLSLRDREQKNFWQPVIRCQMIIFPVMIFLTEYGLDSPQVGFTHVIWENDWHTSISYITNTEMWMLASKYKPLCDNIQYWQYPPLLPLRVQYSYTHPQTPSLLPHARCKQLEPPLNSQSPYVYIHPRDSLQVTKFF